MKRELTQKQLYIATLVIGIVFMLALAALIGIPMLNFAGDTEAFRIWVYQRGIFGKAVYILMVFIQVVIAIIPGEPVEIAGGYAFGTVEGTLLCILAATFGSMTVFYLVKRMGRKFAEVFFSKEKLNSLKFLKHSKKRDFVILFIFMLPGTPKDLISYFVGLTDIKPVVWLLICSLGRIPSVLTSTLGGDALGKESYISAIIVFAATFLISVTGILIYNAYCNRKHKEK